MKVCGQTTVVTPVLAMCYHRTISFNAQQIISEIL